MAIRDASLEGEHGDVALPPTGRPVVRGIHGLVAAGHYLTAMSATRVLLNGGNAFDAAAAAGFAAAVVEPTASYSLAAEGVIMLYHAGSGRMMSLSGQGVAPGAATVDFFRQRGFDKIPTGPGPNTELSFTVPGVVDAFIQMQKAYGVKTLDETMAPAIEYAEHGFPMYDYMRRRLQGRRSVEQFRRYPPGGMDPFFPDGSPPESGQLVVQKQLATTLNKMVEAERKAGGDRSAGLQAARDEFYCGETADTIVRCSQRVGGLLSKEDLASYEAGFDEPLRTTFMGHEIYAQPTWTQGAVFLQAANILENFDLRAMGHNSPQYIHTFTEAMKLAFADRDAYYGDPEFSEVPMDALLSKEYAAERAKLIRRDTALPVLSEPGDPWRSGKSAPAPVGGVPGVAEKATADMSHMSDEGTTHYAIIDAEGNMVSITPSGGAFSTSVFFPELGCALSTRSEMFYLKEGHPNGLEPGKRPRTTLVSYIVSKDRQPVMTLGCPGGDNQPQSCLQLLLNVLLFGMDPQQAVEAPRFSCWSMVFSFYPQTHSPGQLNLEAAIPSGVRRELAAMGHKILEMTTCGTGAVVTQRDPETGTLSAGADPRRTTYAIGW